MAGQHSGFDLEQDYEERNTPIVLDRLPRAGVRLGALLNSVFERP
jgi:hypothetical protein